MVASVVDGVALRALVSCVPARVETTADLAARFGADVARRIAEATGIDSRHLVQDGQCFSDLATAAAQRLLSGCNWAPDSIDLLVVVSQSPDYPLPGTALLLHRRLGLPARTAAFDVNLGCSGFVYGLWMAASLLRSLGGRRALLVAGDATSRLLDPADRTVAPLFGDAAGVAALEADATAAPMTFVLGSDGTGAPYLTVPGGGMREPERPARLFMDGTQVFAFTLREVPGNIQAALAAAGKTIADIDFVVMHQANRQMLDRLARKVGATPAQMVYALADYGNTSSASVPLAITSALAQPLTTAGAARWLLASAFGVGWSWGSAVIRVESLRVCETIIFSA
jgi:3-oxoacyl-[acyl-carrier-protein] synthase-3